MAFRTAGFGLIALFALGLRASREMGVAHLSNDRASIVRIQRPLYLGRGDAHTLVWIGFGLIDDVPQLRWFVVHLVLDQPDPFPVFVIQTLPVLSDVRKKSRQASSTWFPTLRPMRSGRLKRLEAVSSIRFVRRPDDKV